MSWCRLDTDVRKIFSCKVSSNAVVRLPRNFQVPGYFRKKTITAAEVVFIQLLSYHVVSKQKKKNENRIPVHFHIIQKSPLLKTRESRFSPVWAIEFSIISSCLNK